MNPRSPTTRTRAPLAVALALAAQAACGKATAPPVSASSGSMGIITVTENGVKVQKLFLPQQSPDANGAPTIAVLDAAYSGTGKALLDTISLTGHTDQSLANATAAGNGVVVAVGYQSPFVDFIDPVADKVTATITLPTAIVQASSNFSGGGGQVTGVVVDPVGNRAILAVAAGFLPIDLTTHAVGTLVPAAPAENFGFWPAKGYVIAPFYDCPSCAASMPAAGVQLVDLAAGKSYLLAGTLPVGSEPDAADLDPTTGIATIADEASSGGLYTLNLNAPALDAKALTFTAPLGQAPTITTGFTGVAVDPFGHRALLELEFSSTVAIVTLPEKGPSGAVSPSVASAASLPVLPDGTGWQNSGDPHGLAVSVGLVSGSPVGFVAYSDNTWVARIDLDGFAAAKGTDGQVAPADFDPLVTFIPAK